MSKRKNRLINQFHNLSIFKKLFNYLIIKFRSFIVKLLNWSLKINGEVSPIRLILFLLFVPLLLLLISILRRFFDASRMEQLARYFSSREGQVMVKIYILLIVVAIIFTFPKQIRWILNKLQITIHKLQTIIKHQITNPKTKKFVAWNLKFVWKLLFGIWNFIRSLRNHKRKTI